MEYLGGIYHTIILKDVVKRLNITDIRILESVVNLCLIIREKVYYEFDQFFKTDRYFDSTIF